MRSYTAAEGDGMEKPYNRDYSVMDDAVEKLMVIPCPECGETPDSPTWYRHGACRVVGERETPIESVLSEAERVINGEKRGDYGDVNESFQQIADLWSAALRHQFSALDVGLCLALMKVGRLTYGWKRDSLVDLAGYTGLMAQLLGEEKK